MKPPLWKKLLGFAPAREPEPAPSAPLDPADVARRAALVPELAAEFGYDPSLVTLSLEQSSFQLAGESCAAEGRALADGRILVYYDPQMSNARMGCCLAHEIQHQKYFAVRAAFRAEAPGGPLHRAFARFTPALLAKRRGVSDYSNEHWDAWRGGEPPVLFGDEAAEGAAEPINETLAEIAKADYNFGPAAKIDPLWRELFGLVNETYARLEAEEPIATRASGWGSSSPSAPSHRDPTSKVPGARPPADPADRTPPGGAGGRGEPGRDEPGRPATFSGLWGFRKGREEDAAVSPIAAIATAIEARLRAIDLYARAKYYGGDFCEIAASTSPKLLTKPNDPRASGIALLLAGKYDPPTLVFEEVNSLQKGLGAAMVGAVLAGLEESPAMFRRLRVDDASPRGADGRSFWERMAERHAAFDWAITRNERERAASL